METKKTSQYTASQIKVLEAVRDALDLPEIANQIVKRGDSLNKARELNIRPDVFNRAMAETRILNLLPNTQTSKAAILSSLKTDGEVLLFSKKYDIKNISARTLKKLIREWNSKIQENPNMLLTDQQNDLIVGSTIGDASVRQRDKNCNFRVGHTKKQQKYLMFKYDLLKEFTKSEPSWNTRNIKGIHIVRTLEMSTKTHYVFNFYRRLFYKNGRKIITRKALDLLNPRSLAFWVCDDGSFDNRQGYIILCTNSFSKKEHEIMKKYFNEVWNLDPTIGFRDNKYYYLRFKQEDSKKLIKIIRPHIPKSMKYKVGEKNE